MSNNSPRNRSSFPALGYLTRLTTAWNGLLIEQTADAQAVWDDVKAGKFKVKNVAKLLANGLDGYYDVLTEATRTEGEASRTVWIHIPFSKQQGGPAEFPAALSRQQPENTICDGSPFKHTTDVDVLADAYTDLKMIGKRKLLVKLDTKQFQNAKEGQYMSFVTARNRGPGQPLVIVLLDITA
jgi:hypothetical protein